MSAIRFGQELTFLGAVCEQRTRRLPVLSVRWLDDKPAAPVLMGRNGRAVIPTKTKNGNVDRVGVRNVAYNSGSHRSAPRDCNRRGHGTEGVTSMQHAGYRRPATPWQERFWRYITPTEGDGCWEWQGARNEHGYGRLSRGRTGEGQIKAHRASYEIHYGVDPGPLHVCHRCDNPPCVNPAHLFLGTMEDNLQDCAAKGRTGPQRGKSGKRKLSDAEVISIREAALAGEPFKVLAERYGVTRTTISDLALFKTRKDLGGPMSESRRPGLAVRSARRPVA